MSGPVHGARLRLPRPGLDALLFWGLFFGYLAALLATVHDLGYARDEGFYFHAARQYGRWFELLASDPGAAFERDAIDRYWRENHEHPALMKTLFWASAELFHGSVLREPGTAYRLPGMLLSALAVATVFAWGRRALGRVEGLVAALFFAGMPRVFYHSHLSCFDMPIVALWLFCAYAYYRSLEAPGLRWPLVAAFVYGLALNTKHNAWLLPFALGLHVLARQGRWLWPQLRRGRLRVPLALPLMVTLGPVMLWATWPWLWHDTGKRLLEYVRFHLNHVHYNMEFLGQTYFEPPLPRGYAWLMTLATVPAVTLTCAAIGAGAAFTGWWSKSRAGALPPPDFGAARRAAPASLWLICVLTSYAFWLSSRTPIFGGTKHWLTAYPFLALFAGQGFGCLCRRLVPALERLRFASRLGRAAGPVSAACLASLLVAGPLVMTWHSHPWGLSAYTPIVGGAPGAASLGLNRTFWGYTTGAVVPFLREQALPKDRVFVHDTAGDSFRMLQRDRRLRRDLKPWWTVAGSRLALYHHEQHMSRVEHMIWVDYGTTRPAHVATFDGVPVIWVYERPGTRPAAKSPP